MNWVFDQLEQTEREIYPILLKEIGRSSMKKLMRCIKVLLRRILKRLSSTPTSGQRSPQINSRPLDTSIPTVSPRWQSGLILVCSQCAVERSPTNPHRADRSSTSAEDLQNWLKSRLKFEGLWGEYRVVSTSCLGVCPQSGVTVVLGSDAGSKGKCLIVNPQRDRELLYSRIKQGTI